ncbi:hypothetical protein NM688_g5891 [Phlebia brevispora]|uniref:Uncharacterized protein n=1 Tax=Phlebia brevispora TaxID=194682 RepID=A0ACC1SNM1_9APHY|nr:hypothetical protein NM688_g5891 [Phlebia brevispora]
MDEEPVDVTSIVRNVFLAVWDEYFTWEQTTSADTLSSLGSDFAGNSEGNSEFEILLSQTPLQPAPPVQPPEELFIDEEEYTVYDIGSSEKRSASRTMVSKIVWLPQSDFLPIDPYEACVPTYRVILHGDDPNDLPFVPYADEPDFDATPYVLEHKRFAWQSGHHGPDVKWICIETARRVHFEHGVHLSDIDASGVLPFKILPHGNPLGEKTTQPLLWWMKQTDPPDWPPLREAIVLLSQEITCTGERDWSQRAQDLLRLFCANLNCTQAYCWSHAAEIHNLSKDTRYQSFRSSSAPEEPCIPCGQDCCLHANAESETRPDLDYSDMHMLFLLFALSPEASACDLAVVSRIPCREVHAHRQMWRLSLGDTARTDPPEPPIRRRRRKIINEGDKKTAPGSAHVRMKARAPQLPIAHAIRSMAIARGRAAANYAGKAAIVHHTKGSDTEARHVFNLDHALVVRLDENVTLRRVAAATSVKVQNSQMQRKSPKVSNLAAPAALSLSRRQHLKVQTSEWGFGVVLGEDVRAHDLITGELIYDATLESRDLVARHRKRFYAHALNADFNVDASFSGNESRYINHAESSDANCEVQIKVVNGEHRIGIYASKYLSL